MAVNVQRAAASDGGLRRIRSLRPEGALVRCATESSEILIPRVPALHLRTSDALRTEGPDSPVHEFLAALSDRRHNSKQLYFGRIGYATQPKSDKREEFFVRAEVLETGLGIRALHLANAAVTDYFYRLGQKPGEPTLYDILKVTRTASPADLRLSYRLRRIELETSEAGKIDLQRTERAFNLLAHPELRSCYDALLQDPNAPAAFPYGAFGQCVVAGELAADGNTFFVRRILAYLPNQCQRQFRAPLRRIEYLNEHAVYRDSRRRAEVYIDRTLLPIGWDPSLESVEASHRPKGRHRRHVCRIRQVSPIRWRVAPGPMANSRAESSLSGFSPRTPRSRWLLRAAPIVASASSTMDSARQDAALARTTG